MVVSSTRNSWQILNNVGFHCFLIFLVQITLSGATTAGRLVAWIRHSNMQLRWIQTLGKLMHLTKRLLLLISAYLFVMPPTLFTLV